jgi:hypothetical protein
MKFAIEVGTKSLANVTLAVEQLEARAATRSCALL